MDHLARVRQEFSRQAGTFGTAAAVADPQQTARFIAALGAEEAGVALDLACGPGLITAPLALRARAVVALDLTPGMLEKARERCARAGAENVTFQEGNATALPFADGTFDTVATRLSIHHFEDPRRVLDEIHRVLRPGGRLVLADVTSAEDAGKSALQNAIEVIRDPSHTRMLPGTELLALIRDAGFAVEATETWDKPREFEEWAGIVDDPTRIAPLRVMAEALARLGEDAGMGLRLNEGRLVFNHRWCLAVARRVG